MPNYDCCGNCIHSYYSQFAPLGEVSCEFISIKFVKLTDICERYKTSNNEEEDNNDGRE